MEWRTRVEIELSELTIKINKLSNFLQVESFEIGDSQSDLLTIQLGCMKAYQSCLKARLKN